MRSHFRISSGAAAMCAVSGATAMLTGIASAQPYIAFDCATNSTYAGANGWQAGQNGGYGFTAWSFDGTGPSSVEQGIDSSSTFNHLGTSWRLYNPTGDAAGHDVANAGRGFAPLQVGQTFETVLENPAVTQFYRGYTIRLASGTNNATATECTSAYTFEYFSYGRWYVGDGSGNVSTSLVNTDTEAAGMKLDVLMTSTNTYQLTMTPLNNPANAYTMSGTLKINAPVNWILYQFYNTDSDPAQATDFYIRSMAILPLTLNIQHVGPNVVLSWPTNTPGFNLESTSNLGPAAAWQTNSTVPVVINGQYVVTNSITGTQQFYRLKQ